MTASTSAHDAATILAAIQHADPLKNCHEHLFNCATCGKRPAIRSLNATKGRDAEKRVICSCGKRGPARAREHLAVLDWNLDIRLANLPPHAELPFFGVKKMTLNQAHVRLALVKAQLKQLPRGDGSKDSRVRNEARAAWCELSQIVVWRELGI